MKFSEQGLEKIENYSSVDLEIEGLEPEDFVGVVVLTTEEARYLKDILSNLFENIWCGYVKPYQINPHTIKREIVSIEKRIKQAEKQNANN